MPDNLIPLQRVDLIIRVTALTINRRLFPFDPVTGEITDRNSYVAVKVHTDSGKVYVFRGERYTDPRAVVENMLKIAPDWVSEHRPIEDSRGPDDPYGIY